MLVALAGFCETKGRLAHETPKTKLVTRTCSITHDKGKSTIVAELNGSETFTPTTANFKFNRMTCLDTHTHTFF